MKNRAMFRKTDVLWIVTLLLLCGVFWLAGRSVQKEGAVAQISENGQVVKTVFLKKAKDEIFALPDKKNVSFQVKNHRIRFYHATCPDKICEKTGFLSKAGQTAVCLPNRVVLRILSDSSDVDAIAV